VEVEVKATENADVQDPFRLLTNKTVIESHGKTVVIVEFTPNEIGEFKGCVAAQSGEFIHTVGLSALVR
jgi:hypothetical protein